MEAFPLTPGRVPAAVNITTALQDAAVAFQAAIVFEAAPALATAAAWLFLLL